MATRRPAPVQRRSRAPIAGVVAALVTALLGPVLLGTASSAVADGQEPRRAGAADGEAPPQEPPAPTRLRVVTYNAGAGQSVEQAVADVERLVAQDPDVIALQEFSSWEKRVAVRERWLDCDGCVWDALMPVAAVPGGLPILYRADRLQLVDQATTMVVPERYVGPRGAGPSTLRARYVNRVRLKDLRTGRAVTVLNTHAVPSVQGRDGGPNPRMRARLAMYRDHMAGLQALVTEAAQRNGLVAVTGDMNVNYRRDRVLRPEMFPVARLGGVGLTVSYAALGEPSTGTHVLPNGNDLRLIDQVWFSPLRPFAPTGQQLGEGYASDHRPVLVDFAVSTRRGWVPPAVEPDEQVEPTGTEPAR